MKKQNKLRWLLCGICLGAVIAAILWITLAMRSPEASIRIKPPFWSYAAILKGNRAALWEDLANIVMFFPLGLLISALWERNTWQTALIALIASLWIELLQLVFHLGCFELDDIVHNTLGAYLGCRLALAWKLRCPPPSGVRSAMVVCLSALVFLAAGYGARELRQYEMRAFAALSDRPDAQNLLVMNGRSGVVEGTRVAVRYRKDGTMAISGTSKIRTWKRLADLELQPGTYSFSGLSGVAENTVALELEYFSEEAGTYIRLTRDIGPIEEEKFTLPSVTQIRAYIGIYPGCDCDVVARPVLYLEEE